MTERAPRRAFADLVRGKTYAIEIDTDRIVAWLIGTFEGWGDMRRVGYEPGAYAQFNIGRLRADDHIDFVELFVDLPEDP